MFSVEDLLLVYTHLHIIWLGHANICTPMYSDIMEKIEDSDSRSFIPAQLWHMFILSKSNCLQISFKRSNRCLKALPVWQCALFPPAALLSPLKRELLLRVRSEIETVTDGWLSTAIKSLLLIQSRWGSGPEPAALGSHRSNVLAAVLHSELLWRNADERAVVLLIWYWHSFVSFVYLTNDLSHLSPL